MGQTDVGLWKSEKNVELPGNSVSGQLLYSELLQKFFSVYVKSLQLGEE